MTFCVGLILGSSFFPAPALFLPSYPSVPAPTWLLLLLLVCSCPDSCLRLPCSFLSLALPLVLPWSCPDPALVLFLVQLLLLSTKYCMGANWLKERQNAPALLLLFACPAAAGLLLIQPCSDSPPALRLLCSC